MLQGDTVRRRQSRNGSTDLISWQYLITCLFIPACINVRDVQIINIWQLHLDPLVEQPDTDKESQRTNVKGISETCKQSIFGGYILIHWVKGWTRTVRGQRTALLKTHTMIKAWMGWGCISTIYGNCKSAMMKGEDKKDWSHLFSSFSAPSCSTDNASVTHINHWRGFCFQLHACTRQNTTTAQSLREFVYGFYCRILYSKQGHIKHSLSTTHTFFSLCLQRLLFATQRPIHGSLRCSPSHSSMWSAAADGWRGESHYRRSLFIYRCVVPGLPTITTGNEWMD